MSKILKIFQRAEKYDPVHPRDPGLVKLFGGMFNNTAAGVPINHDNALNITAFYSGVDMISKSISILPIELMREEDGKTTKAVEDHRYSLLSRRPNRFQNSIDYRRMMIISLLIRGRAVAEIIMNRAGIITDLIPLHPDYITPFRASDGTIAFAYQSPGNKRRILLADEVIDMRGISLDGVNCVSPVEANAETLGITKASEIYAGKYFGNGTVLSGVAETDSALSDIARRRLEEDFNRRKAVGRAHGTMILEEGLKWRPITVTPETAQLLQTRAFGVAEVARILQMPGYKLGLMDAVKFNTVEQQSIDYVTDTLLPSIRLFEMTHEQALLSVVEQRSLTIKMSLSEMLRGDSKTRVEYHKGMFYMGAMNQNEIRANEGLNPIPDGERYYVAVNLIPTDKVDQMLTVKGKENNTMRGVIENMFERIQTSEINAQARRKDMVKFMSTHKDFIRKVLEPAGGRCENFEDYLTEYYINVLNNFEKQGKVNDNEFRSKLDAAEFINRMGL